MREMREQDDSIGGAGMQFTGPKTSMMTDKKPKFIKNLLLVRARNRVFLSFSMMEKAREDRARGNKNLEIHQIPGNP